MHQETFDVWYPGYIDNIGNFRHTISFFTETALYRYATPHFYTVDEFPAARQGLGTEMLYSSPWKGGWWRLADACRYMYEADMAVLNLSVEVPRADGLQQVPRGPRHHREVREGAAVRLRDSARAARRADGRAADGEADAATASKCTSRPSRMPG